MAAYEKALNQMIIENDVKSDIGEAINKAGCIIATEYFKKIQGSGCYFQTADKVWWDITDIEHPIISLKDQITNEDESAAIKAKADSLDDDKTSFVMVGEIKDGIVRINDKGATTTTPDSTYLSKLYAFINNETVNNDSEECGTSLFCQYSGPEDLPQECLLPNVPNLPPKGCSLSNLGMHFSVMLGTEDDGAYFYSIEASEADEDGNVIYDCANANFDGTCNGDMHKYKYENGYKYVYVWHESGNYFTDNIDDSHLAEIRAKKPDSGPNEWPIVKTGNICYDNQIEGDVDCSLYFN